MVKNNLIKSICDQEMDRKEFLKYSGIALLGVFGLKGLVSLLTLSEKKIALDNNGKDINHGFGSGKYGA